MLLVETYLDRSPLSGIGVFTPRAITRGTLLWEPHEGVDLCFSPGAWEAFLSRLSAPVRGDMRRHAYKEDGQLVLCLDNARFMNHGGDGSNVQNVREGNLMIARRDIPAGSELLCDYREYSDDDDRHLGLLGLGPSHATPAGAGDPLG